MSYINLNETPEAIYELKDGDLVYLDNQRMEFQVTGDRRVYLSATNVITREGFYKWAHARHSVDNRRAVHDRWELIEMIRAKAYYIY